MSDWFEKIVAETPWWPPKVGDILRKEEYFSDAERSRAERAVIVKRVAAKVHVLAVFEHDDETWIAGAIWFPTKQRWSRQVFGIIEASYQLWPDGQRPPSKAGAPPTEEQ